MPACLGNFSALGRPQKNHLTFDTAKVLMISSSSKLLSSNFVLINVNRNKSGFNGYTKVSKCRNVDFFFLQNARSFPAEGETAHHHHGQCLHAAVGLQLLPYGPQFQHCLLGDIFRLVAVCQQPECLSVQFRAYLPYQCLELLLFHIL